MAALGVDADFLAVGIDRAGLAAILAELAGELAFGIARAADKGAVPAELQGKLALMAERAFARIGLYVSVRIRLREDIRPERLVEGVEHMGDAQVLGLADGGFELLPELGEEDLPVQLAIGNDVELFLQIGGEVVFDIAPEEILQEGRDQAPLVFWIEALLIDADIVAVLQRGDDRGIGRGSANAELFQPLDQACFGKARRRLGEMLAGSSIQQVGMLAPGQFRQALFIILIGRLVAALGVEADKAIEDQHLAGGAQAGAAILGDKVDRGALELGWLHLARRGAAPDQGIELPLVGIGGLEVLRGEREIGRADGLVSFLGVLGLGRIAPRFFRQVLRAIGAGDLVAGGAIGFLGHVHAIGPHIGDAAGLVEFLRGLHGALGAEAEAARGILLQGGGDEGRRRVALDRLGLDIGHRVAADSHCFERGGGSLAIGQVEFLEGLAVEAMQAGLEIGAVRGAQLRLDLPVFLRLEGLDFQLAVADQAQRYRLHPAGRTRAGQLAPQHRGEVEADQIIERPAGEIGVHQLAIDLARMLHCSGDGVLCNGVEHHPLDIDILEHTALFQHFEQVPGNRLALAVGVGCEDELFRALHSIGDLADAGIGL